MTYREKITAAGRTWLVERSNVPSKVESTDGPELIQINLKDPSLVPSNLSKPDGTPMPILEATGLRIDLSKRTHEAMSFWHRNADQDEVILCVEGQIHWETELGNTTLNAGEVLVIPRGIAHRSLPGSDGKGGSNLIVELKVANPVEKRI